ncbi:MAG: DUF5018 domain-containing protein [Dysgonamonadaceae bacterium]|jgi:hypothetical protein|nr:DUF5018 domain-containing protein [Dysgonamonadaceae bacterium]
MKLKNIFSGLLLFSLAFSACKEEDVVDFESRVVDKDLFSVTAYLTKDYQSAVKADIDNTNKTIVFNLPYYASDTEPIMSQTNNLILAANLPDGAKISPALSGISDLTNPVTVTVTFVNGEVADYVMSAKLVKSSKADITKLVLPDLPLVTTNIDVKDGENKILIYRTSSTVFDALQNAKVEFLISPWATVSIADGTYMNLTVRNKITVTAQDGTQKDYYTEMVDPAYVPYGKIGVISVLFGWQTTNADPKGFVENSNRSLAVVDNELIVSYDNGNFLRFNRFTGAKLDKTVNTSGTGNIGLFGIDSDDNGVLLAVCFSMVGNATYSSTVDFFVWKNGLDSPPTKIMSKPTTELIASGDIGRTISVKGNLLSGRAKIGLLAKTLKRGFLFTVENGEVIDANSPWVGNYGVTFNNNGKIIPMNTDDNPSYILSGIDGRTQYYCTTSPASTLPISAGGDWWATDIKGSDYIEFNGVKMLATQNGLTSSNVDAYNRLVIANITTYAANAFTANRIMDSRLQNFDPNVSGTQNATLTGMTSYYHSSGTVGANGNKTGDVCFGSNSDGSAVQVYMMTTGHGILAYDISRFEPF